jgi:ATP-dependent protease HslVU (ClpYQ) peptidase subunit
MTCIVGVRGKGAVWLGGDSAGIDGALNLRLRQDPKVFRRGEIGIGFTTSFRMGQLLMAKLDVPALPGRSSDLYRWMVADFVDAVRHCLKEGGFAARSNEVESAGCFLVAARGRLFSVESDYQVGEEAGGLSAVGCGHAYAMGALYATPASVAPARRVMVALRAAEALSAGVRRPFRVIKVPA